jgi:hypothetical protein
MRLCAQSARNTGQQNVPAAECVRSNYTADLIRFTFENWRMSKILLDTNVLIYAVDEESSFYPASRALLDSEHELFTSCKNISEFLAVLTRAPITSISLEDALATVDDFRTIMTE